MYSPESPSILPRLLLADGKPGTFAHIKDLLEAEFDLVGMVVEGSHLIEAAHALQPDIIVSDISMPTIDGIEAARSIKTRDDHAKIVFLSADDDPMIVQEAMSSGASAYVLKESAASDLIPALHAALEGKRYFSPSLLCPHGRIL